MRFESKRSRLDRYPKPTNSVEDLADDLTTILFPLASINLDADTNNNETYTDEGSLNNYES
ncbi:hypothetical protein EDC19_0171 [Natranaerovirga hydrolytica]|uniref:Uncharacterized protein n=1 Tax=Natranaerovirga hydrolytica TaxID=680378 RepID=A0A4R1N4B2_9FIRM|nr:hypothetical protein [Natranaerovirga hydrolytica]TCK97769.1 hypothetical protein EDC19_0171 [Natranaerovirga hydrolytica]